MGWINTARYKWAELTGNEIKFKPATFYLGIADYLAKAVEGLEPEDVDARRGGDKRTAKRGHGEMLDGVSQGKVQVETEQAPGSGASALTEAHLVDQPSVRGGSESVDPVLGSGLNHYDGATEISLSTTLEVTTSTQSTNKPSLDTYPPQKPTPGSKLKDPRLIPTCQPTKPYND